MMREIAGRLYVGDVMDAVAQIGHKMEKQSRSTFCEFRSGVDAFELTFIEAN